MAAVGVHFVNIVPKPTNALGGVVNKGTASMTQLLQMSTEFRVEETADVASSTGFPTVEDFVKAEALLGYKVAIINQSYIILYNG